MIVGIVGVGVVGSAVKYGFEKLGHEVLVHDIKLNTTIGNVLDTDVCFICVPTPQKHDGSCDTSIVASVIHEFSRCDYEGVVAIKSTIEPGETERLSRIYHNLVLCFVPEFLRERCAIADFTENHDICVIGTHSNHVFELIKDAHGKYPKKFVQMSPTEAELSKYFSNIFNALRITFANGFYEVCQRLGADYTKIKDAVVQRPTMVDMYLDCNEKFRGFAGVCLPKDSAALAKLADDLGVDANIFRTIVEDNKLYQPTVYEHMRME